MGPFDRLKDRAGLLGELVEACKWLLEGRRFMGGHGRRASRKRESKQERWAHEAARRASARERLESLDTRSIVERSETVATVDAPEQKSEEGNDSEGESLVGLNVRFNEQMKAYWKSPAGRRASLQAALGPGVDVDEFIQGVARGVQAMAQTAQGSAPAG